MMRVTLILALLHRRAAGQGKVPLGPFTAQLHTDFGVEESIEDCNNMVACAGVTFQRECQADTWEAGAGLLAPSLSPAPEGSTSREEQAEEDEEEENAIYFHGFLPPLQDGNVTGWETHRSSKPFVFHRGKLFPTHGSHTYTIARISVDEAKASCQADPDCAGFTFPVHSTDLILADNVTFATSIEAIVSPKDDDEETWRTFVSNDESRASKVNPTAVELETADLMIPYKSCCNRNSPMPSIAEVEKMDTLPRIPCSISREEFHDKYEKTRTPVMLVGCDEGWPAHERWTFDELIPRFSNDTLWRAHTHNTGLKPTKHETIVEAMRNNFMFYIFDQLDNPDLFPIREDYETPAPFRGADLFKKIDNFPPGYGTMRWFCVGTPESGTFPHMDPHGTDAWNSVISGHKWWILYPEAAEDEDELECDEACSVDGYTEAHWYASVGIDAARSEYGKNGERPQHVLQKPGETIYVPFPRLHSVMNMDHTMAVTANFGAEGNLPNVWETILQDGFDSHWQKLYYTVLNKAQRKLVRDLSEEWPPVADGQGDLGEDFEEEEEDETSARGASVLSEDEWLASFDEDEDLEEYLYDEEDEYWDDEEEWDEEEEY